MRLMFFFERYDIMSLLVEKIAKEANGIGKLRSLQAQMRELLIEFQI